MSTHDLGQAKRLAGDIVLLHRGRADRNTARRRNSSPQPRTREAQAIHRRRIAGLTQRTNNSNGGFIMLNRRTSHRRRRLGAVAARRARAVAQDKSIVVSSTTSTQDSGLFGHILPLFKAKTGIEVKVVSQGTGQALDTGRRGDADVVFVHAKSQEEKFVADGFGVKRYPVMYNDFVLIGPKSDPAGIKGIEGHRRRAQARSRPRARRSSRAATSPARTSPSSISGRPPASTSRRTKGPGTSRSARAWAPRSTPRRRRQCLCARRSRHLDLVQEQAAISSSRWKATSGCSTSTASCW